MAIPTRATSHGTFFISTQTYNRRCLFQLPATAELLIQTLQHYRREGNYKLHAFVVMPDHIHLLLTPKEDITLERTVQLVKGGFSHRLASKLPVWQRGFTDHRIRDRTVQLIKGGFSHRLASKLPIWQRGFTDHRIRDRDDFLTYRNYIHHNPVRAHLCQLPGDYPYSSAFHQPIV